jgi:hypothetical protein
MGQESLHRKYEDWVSFYFPLQTQDGTLQASDAEDSLFIFVYLGQLPTWSIETMAHRYHYIPTRTQIAATPNLPHTGSFLCSGRDETLIFLIQLTFKLSIIQTLMHLHWAHLS